MRKAVASEMELVSKATECGGYSEVSKLASTDDVRRRVQDKALAAGEHLFQRAHRQC